MHAYQYETVEVLVLWGERVLSAHTYGRREALYLGQDAGDLRLPGVGQRRPVLKTAGLPRVVMGPGNEKVLETGQVLRLPLPDNGLSLQFRRIPRPPKAEGEALMDLSAVEAAGVLLALAVTVIMAGYTAVFGSGPLVKEERVDEKKIAKVRFLFSPPVTETVSAPVAVSEAVAEIRKPRQSQNLKPSPNPSRPQIPERSRPPVSASTSASGSGSSTRVRPRAQQNTLLTTFNSSGLRDSLNRMAESSAAINQMAGNSTGSGGREEGDGRSGLRPTGSGANSDTVGLGNGPGSGTRTGAPGYTGGLGGKTGIRIQTGGGPQESYSGTMDREGIRRVIREHLNEIRSCYERQLQRSADLYGKIVLQWDIVENGRAVNAKVQTDELADPRVAQCLTSRLLTWRFPSPPPDQVGRVAYPFVFSSK